MIWSCNALHLFAIMWKRNETLKLSSSLSSCVVDTITFDHSVLGGVSSPGLLSVLGHDLLGSIHHHHLIVELLSICVLCSRLLSSRPWSYCIVVLLYCVVCCNIISNPYRISSSIYQWSTLPSISFDIHLLPFIWSIPIFFERAYLAILSKPINTSCPARHMQPIKPARQRPILDSSLRSRRLWDSRERSPIINRNESTGVFNISKQINNLNTYLGTDERETERGREGGSEEKRRAMNWYTIYYKEFQYIQEKGAKEEGTSSRGINKGLKGFQFIWWRKI